MEKGKLRSVVGFAVFTLALSLCSSSGARAADTPKAIKSIGITVGDISNPFWLAMTNGAKESAAGIGATISVQDAAQDLAVQTAQIETFITQKMNLIIVGAVDSVGIAPAVERAKAAGILVVAVGDKAQGASTYAAVDNTSAGAVACEYMAKKIGGKGEVAIIDGTAVSAVIERVVGCEKALKKFKGIKVVAKVAGDNAIGKGQTIATDILTAHPKLKGIFGINDPTALGALLAAKDAKFKNLIIVGVDGAPSAVAELSKPSSMFKGSASQDPRAMVKAVLEAAQKVVGGGAWPAKGILLPSQFITKANLKTYKGWS
jgi:ribose transport system substrate-binding protein